MSAHIPALSNVAFTKFLLFDCRDRDQKSRRPLKWVAASGRVNS